MGKLGIVAGYAGMGLAGIAVAYSVLSLGSGTRSEASVQVSEPEGAARSLWSNLFTRCGAGLYQGSLKPLVRTDSMGSSVLEGTDVLTEYKGVSVRVTPNKLTGSDSLNGVEWDGTTTLSGGYWRAHYSWQGHAWGDWNDVGEWAHPVALRKVKGVWEFAIMSPTWTDEFHPIKDYAAYVPPGPSCADVSTIR